MTTLLYLQNYRYSTGSAKCVSYYYTYSLCQIEIRMALGQTRAPFSWGYSLPPGGPSLINMQLVPPPPQGPDSPDPLLSGLFIVD